MRKLLLSILLIFVLVTSSYATDYYGGAASKNLNDNDLWYTAVTGSCAGDGSPVASATVLQAGNTLYANGCTIAITDSFTATKISTELGGAANAVAGGSFTLTTASVSGKTLTTNVTAGTTIALTLSGNGAGTPVLTILGTFTGGGTANARAIASSHTVGRLNLGAVGTPCTIQGGTAGSTEGFYISSSGPVAIVGNSTAGTLGRGLQNNSTSTMTMTGNCTAGSLGYSGCDSASTGTITLIGNIINTARGIGISGGIVWNPIGPGTTSDNYIKMVGPAVGQWLYVSLSLAASKVEKNYTYGYTGATYYTGELSGGGCSCGF